MWRAVLFLAFFYTISVTFGVQDHTDYLKFLIQHEGVISTPGSASKGEIQLLTNEAEIISAERAERIRLLENGAPLKHAIQWAKAGIAYESPFWYWVRDPVRFPDGAMGIYGRIIPKQSNEGTPYAAVLPVLYDGRFVLNISFRHATRSWEVEVPSGTREGNETPEETARRELFEETGFKAEKLIHLGNMTTDPGMTGVAIPVFLAPVDEQEEPPLEFGEAIAGSLALTIHEIHEGLLSGCIIISINQEDVCAHVRDALITFALYQSMLRAFPARVFQFQSEI